MYIVHSMFLVTVQKVDEVIEIYKNRSRLVDHAEGFITFRLLQNETKPGELTVYMEWETKEAFLAWVSSDEYKRIHELEKKYPDQELASIVPAITRYKVVAL